VIWLSITWDIPDSPRTPFQPRSHGRYGDAYDLQVASTPLVFPYVPGLDFAYRVRFRGWFDQEWVHIQPTTAQLFWANGPTIYDRTSTIPIYSHPIEGVFWRFLANQTNVHVDASLFHDPPDGTTCVLLVLGPVEALLFSGEANSSVSASDSTNKLQMLSTEEFLVAEVTLIKGSASVVRGDEEIPLSERDRVFHNDVIRTADKSLIKLRNIDGSLSTMGSKSELVIDKATLWDNGFLESLYSLIIGSIRSKVEKQFKEGTEPSLKIKTKTAALGVRGTEFEAEYEELDGIGTTRCTVFEGIVPGFADALFSAVPSTDIIPAPRPPFPLPRL
jgi:hypothetical protein